MPVDSPAEPSQLSENSIILLKKISKNVHDTTPVGDNAEPTISESTSVPLANDNNKLDPPKNNSSSQIALTSQNTSWFRLVGYHAVILVIVLLTMNYVYYNLENNIIIMSFAIYNSAITTQPFIILLLSHKFRI